MSMTGLEVFDRTIHRTNIWLKDLMETLATESRQRAYSALRATLHATRDRLRLRLLCRHDSRWRLRLQQARWLWLIDWRLCDARGGPRQTRSDRFVREEPEEQSGDADHCGYRAHPERDPRSSAGRLAVRPRRSPAAGPEHSLLRLLEFRHRLVRRRLRLLGR